MLIRIIRPPSGEAPEYIRAAWVGIILPASWKTQQPVEVIGVLSRPNTWIGWIFKRVFGRLKRKIGYVVIRSSAFEALEKHSPEAAKWWHTHSPHDGAFLFDTESCEELSPIESLAEPQ